jgi:putative flippase GtrA
MILGAVTLMKPRNRLLEGRSGLERLRKLGILRAAKFGVAGIVGFAVLEAIVVAGLYAIYGKFDIPGSLFTSPVLIALDVAASAIGVVVGFFVNEKITVVDRVPAAGGTLLRLAKFEVVYAAGSAITIGVQLALLAVLSVSPPIGNVVGAMVAFPPSYFISMRTVWKVKLRDPA